ncbi:MAG: hypothetical protein AAFZ01_12675 [Pseudomonadota bacterium]
MRFLSTFLNASCVLGFAAAVLAGCASTQGPPVATCLDDSQSCVSQRRATLNAMLADPQRKWVSARPGPRVYATGVRLFAWRKTKAQLSCGELQAGIAETGRARQTLAGPMGGASRTRIGQIIALSDDVNGELKKVARGKRCRA